jgi:hypothetical protein
MNAPLTLRLELALLKFFQPQKAQKDFHSFWRLLCFFVRKMGIVLATRLRDTH